MIFLRKPSGNELLVKPDFLHETFPDWKTLRRAGELSTAHSRDKDHLSKKRVFCGENLSRVHVFQVPPDGAIQNGIFEV